MHFRILTIFLTIYSGTYWINVVLQMNTNEGKKLFLKNGIADEIVY